MRGLAGELAPRRANSATPHWGQTPTNVLGSPWPRIIASSVSRGLSALSPPPRNRPCFGVGCFPGLAAAALRALQAVTGPREPREAAARGGRFVSSAVTPPAGFGQGGRSLASSPARLPARGSRCSSGCPRTPGLSGGHSSGCPLRPRPPLSRIPEGTLLGVTPSALGVPEGTLLWVTPSTLGVPVRSQGSLRGQSSL